MTTATLSKTDVRMRDLVLRQLEWDRAVDASAVAVTVHGGVVTLTGYVDTYSGKLAAERAAKRVHGVRAVANDIDVRLMLDRTDSDIAEDAACALQLRGDIPAGVQTVVHRGHITLTGTVGWIFEKVNAEKAVRHIRGVRGVVNRIAVAPRSAERDLRRRIVAALHRDADVDAHQISVAVAGDVATLTGNARSCFERDAAERAVANAPGIREVDNRIAVEPPDRLAFDDIC